MNLTGFSMDHIISRFDDNLNESQQDAHENALSLRLCAIRAAQELNMNVKNFLQVEGF